MLFNQRSLEYQRLLLSVGKNCFHPLDMGEHGRGFRVDRAAEVGILTEALTQVARLADVEHLFFAEHLVDARPMTDGGEEFGG